MQRSFTCDRGETRNLRSANPGRSVSRVFLRALFAAKDGQNFRSRELGERLEPGGKNGRTEASLLVLFDVYLELSRATVVY